MKNLLVVFAISALSLLILSFTGTNNQTIATNPGNDVSFEIPDDVQAIINNSCYVCHSDESSSTTSKMKLNFDKLPEMKVGKQVGKLIKISNAVKEGAMPKENFIEKYPDKKLSIEDSNKLTSWAEELANKLGGE
ncbi:MAG: heme-binding domain-containing protein [Bacteroidetes bacterium]|nr:heme-binding domain-containing protein [Bacteroidota bacterium]MBL6943004.1 heme-binding domain-containing protein [Bacteroidales bacterium]